MKKITLYFLLLTLPVISHGQWNQLGTDIDGENAGDESATSISINDNGTVMVVGVPRSDALETNAGNARVYEWNGTAWIQKGADIDATGAGDLFGQSVDINATGDVIIVGAPGFLAGPTAPGYASVYEWDGTNWTQRGTDFIGEAADDSSGGSVSISADGSIIGIGAGDNGGNGPFSGHVRIFEWDGINWNQLGVDIDGEAPSDASGRSISLNAAGNIIAIGAPNNGDNGHVRVFEWNGTNWIQKGIDIDSDALNNNFGKYISLDATGNTFASGAHTFSNGAVGSAKIYTWDGANWIQKGTTLVGDQGSDFFGTSTKLNEDGNIVAIGALGYARIFKYDGTDWIQQGIDLVEEVENDQFGRSISVSNDGSIVAVGTPFNNENGNSSGHVRVFNNPALSVDEFSQTTIRYYPNPTQNSVHFSTSEKIENITLYNLLGQEVFSKKGNSNTLDLDLSYQPSGHYLAKIQTKNTVQTIKLIKI